MRNRFGWLHGTNICHVQKDVSLPPNLAPPAANLRSRSWGGSGQNRPTARRSPESGAIKMSEAGVPARPVISIVDDDPSVRAGTMDLLSSMGFIAQTFRHADDFLESDRRYGTSCLIADVQLPGGMSGLDLYDYLVWSGEVVPTILITAFPNDKDQARARRAGVSGYLTKPFSENDLLACIRSALESQQPIARGP
jgi:CheY-like chemotaxis protein